MPAPHIEETYRRPLVDRLVALAARRDPALSRALPRRARRRPASRGRFAGFVRPHPGPGAPRRHARPRAGAPAAARACRPAGHLPRRTARAAAASRCSAAAPSACSIPASTTPRSGSSPATASRWCWRKGEGCCGALVHHMGRAERVAPAARDNIDAWTREIDGEGLDAIVSPRRAAARRSRTTASCSATTRPMPTRRRGSRRSPRTSPSIWRRSTSARRRARRALTVAYHAACSLQHGQQIRTAPKALLARAGFTVREPAEAISAAARPAPTTCCSRRSPARLRDRKVANIEATGADVIATGNIGCMTQIGSGTRHAGRPHGRAARLGLWRPEAGGTVGRNSKLADQAMRNTAGFRSEPARHPG